MTSGEPAVRVSDLHKQYPKHRAVDGLSFEIHRGETFALLGPNGAGKSTTVEILEGYRRRTSGQVSVLGEDPGTAGRPWRSRIGIVLQDLPESEVYGVYSVREQITQQSHYYPNPRDVQEVIDAVGLRAKADAKVRTLSGGQRRRLDVALGIIGRPELLFLDEPTTGFDPEARREFWGLIRGLSADGTTILLTTHYLDEAAELADRVGIIIGGRMRAIGPVGEIGGDAARTPIVSWTEPDGEAHSQRTPAPAALVAELTARLGEPRDLEIRRPHLEEIYLDMVAAHAAGAATGTEDVA
ncbi:ABC transporter ATP-binding protein [Serinibacter salmoneus]|uniref:ABC-2 type transport system ATP-binding protein n=1 Tax=Serinibacter salmoneus TaxID=556530 RepID=A0A2A9CYA1_9MICO|nr:ABC transporter ATP-binding protein [Serinibacter salmoneus]PFG19116.1 ABC-2 type transport system ATP-binding protein [Serinibacter salmoneus]